MAIVDVDRHILLELTSQVEKKKKLFKDFSQVWDIISDVIDKTEILLSQPDSLEKKEALERLRKKVIPAVRKAKRIILGISISSAKSDALLTHLVGRVEQAHTGKGTENGAVE